MSDGELPTRQAAAIPGRSRRGAVTGNGKIAKGKAEYVAADT